MLPSVLATSPGKRGKALRCHPDPHGPAPRLFPLRVSSGFFAASKSICPNMPVTMAAPLPALLDKTRRSVCAASSTVGPRAGIPNRESPCSCGTQQPYRCTALAARQSRSCLPAHIPSARGRQVHHLQLSARASHAAGHVVACACGFSWPLLSWGCQHLCLWGLVPPFT